MGAYREQIVPRIVNVVCDMKVAHPQRRRVCEGLAGEVVEIGFGSGLNVPYYPEAVKRVTAVEPAVVGWKLAAKLLGAGRASRSSAPGWTQRRFRSPTTALMLRCRHGPCAPSRTSLQRWTSCAAS